MKKLPDPDSTTIESYSDSNISALIREEFTKLRAELSEQPKTYAATASEGIPKMPKIKTPASRPAIIISSVNESNGSKDTADAWRKSVSFKDSSFAPVKLQHVSNNKVRVEFETEEHRHTALVKLQAVPELRGEKARRQRPLVIIKGVNKESLTAEQLPNVICKQNSSVNSAMIKPEDFVLRFQRRNRNDALFNAVFEVSPSVRKELLILQRINANHQRVRVEDFSAVVQCYKCLGFGHTKSKCIYSLNCSHCAENGHSYSECPLKDSEPPKCQNCDIFNGIYEKDTNTEHSAFDPKCPQIIARKKHIDSRTDYGP